MSVVLDHPSIVADGVSTTKATATVTDAAGHLLKGQTVAFGSDAGNPMVGSVNDNGDGTYTVVFKSTTAVRSATITATDGALSGSAQSTQTVGPAANVSVVLDHPSIVADGVSTATTATATVTDERHPSAQRRDRRVRFERGECEGR